MRRVPRGAARAPRHLQSQRVSLLAFVEELERLDADVAQALAGVERVQAEVDGLRARAEAIAGFFDRLPAALAHEEASEQRAEDARAAAEAELPNAEELEREHVLHRIAEAQDRVAAARAEHARLLREAERLRLEGAALAAPPVRDVAPPEPGLPELLAWCSLARGALLVEHSGLLRERDAVVREATELAASVLGEPLTAVGVAGLRDRLESAL